MKLCHRALAFASFAVLLPLLSVAQGHLPPKKIQVAEGIFLFITPPYGDFGLDGNSIAIVSSDGVLVFDSNGTPAAAENVLAEIRKITTQPVKYLVHSHWHWDHWYGAEAYKKAFPNITIVTHEKSRAMMAGPAMEFNRPGIEQQLPEFLASLEKRVADGEAASPQPANLPRLRAAVAQGRFFLSQKKSVQHTLATVTFKDKMDIRLGERVIQVLNYGPAVTPGDSFLYLPKEKILITGDLVINPIVFALSSYPTGWFTTLEKMDKLDATVIVPGHGEPLHDKALMHATMDVMRILLREGKACKAQGLDPDQAKAAILPQLRELMVRITKDDPRQNQHFEIYLVDWYLHRVYDELAGPLTDAIKPPPPK